MKKMLSLALVACCFFNGSCKKAESSKPRVPSLSARINGTAFTAETITITNYSNYKVIKGSRSAGNQSITIINADSLGIWSLGIYSPNGVYADSSQAFSLVTETNHTLKSETGVYEFTTADSVIITDGMYQVFW